MATSVIDALVVTLGLDSSQFKAGSAQADKDLDALKTKGDKTAKDLSKSGKEGAEFFKALRNEAIAFFAVLVGGRGLEQLIVGITDANVQLSFMAQNLGITTNELTSWGRAATLAGGSAQGMAATLAGLAESLSDIKLTGTSGNLQYLNRLGIEAFDQGGQARNVTEVLGDIGEKLRMLDRVDAVNIGKKMGIDTDTLNVMLQGREEMARYMRAQEGLFKANAEQLAQSKKLQEAWRGMKLGAESMAQEFVSFVTPALVKFAEWIAENKPLVISFFVAVATVITAVLLPSLIAMIAPFAPMAAAIAAVSAVLALLIEDWWVWLNGGESALGAFWQFFADGWKEAKKNFDVFMDAMRAGWDLIVAIFTGNADQIYDAGKVLGSKFTKGFFEAWRDLTYIGLFKKLYDYVAGPGGKEAKDAGTDMASKAGEWLKDRAKAVSGAVGHAAEPLKDLGTKGTDKAAAIDFFQKSGWSREQAAGIVANLVSESSLRPDALGDGGKAYGVAQWHPDRQAAFQKKYGKSIQGSTLGEQLAFVNYELREGQETAAGARLAKARTAQEAGDIVSRHYERPGDTEGEATRRGGLAARLTALVPIPSALGAVAGPTSPRTGAPGAPSTSTSSHEVSIGVINVHTAATNAEGIARSLAPYLRAEAVSTQADTGLR